MSVEHNPRCAIFNEPPGLRDPKDCDCGAVPPLPTEVRHRGMTQREAAVLVECEKCYAEPGDPCYNAAGTGYVPIHDERVALAERMVKRARERGVVFDA